MENKKIKNTEHGVLYSMFSLLALHFSSHLSLSLSLSLSLFLSDALPRFQSVLFLGGHGLCSLADNAGAPPLPSGPQRARVPAVEINDLSAFFDFLSHYERFLGKQEKEREINI